VHLLSPFWAYQLRTSWRNLDNLRGPSKALALLRASSESLVRHRSAIGAPVVGGSVPDSEKLTVILLNHKRPHNVARIAQYTLRSGFVGKLIISNNSQAYKISDYVKTKDQRLILVDQQVPSGVGIGFDLAQQFDAHYYLRIDDDIFLHPVQLQWIYSSLRLDPSRPHGIFGAALVGEVTPERIWPFSHRRNADSAVDILNGLFAFTREHLTEYFRLSEALGIRDQKSLMNGEDIILSFSGARRPSIHNVGPIWECTSASSPTVALHMSRPQFYEERWLIFSALKRIKALPDHTGLRRSG
jgi:hypothetical protein